MTIIPILLYHSVSDEPEGWIAPYTVTPATFARHVELVVASGRTAMSISGLRAALAGLAPMPARPVAITFDDGFADFFCAAELLARHVLPCTLYATTGALAGKGPRPSDMAIPPAVMLDWAQLGELDELGVEIGAHTHTHPQLDIMDDGSVMNEIRRSKGMLEDALRREVSSFAYPHGFQSRRTRRIVAAAGHSSACAVMNALSSDVDRPYAMARLTVQATTPAALVSDWLTGNGAPVAPYPERLRTTGWRWYRRARGGATRRVISSAEEFAFSMAKPIAAQDKTGE